MSLRSVSMCLRAATRVSPYAPCVATIKSRRLTFDVESSQDFEEKVLNSSKPVLVDFHAHWCGPCKMLTPLLKKTIENQFADTVDLAMVNVDDNEEVAMEYDVRSIPTVVAVKDGKVVNQFIGNREAPFLVDFISELLD